MNTRRRVVYITYDGVLEPLGESQVVSYLEILARDYSITLLSFEKGVDLGDAERLHAMAARLDAAGIDWVRLRYHKNPPVLSTLFDVLRGIWRVRRVQSAALLHARSYVPSLIALGARGRHRAKYLFDMRGFWVDEKVEAGHWPRGGWLSRLGKRCERWFLSSADAVVSLTETGVRALPELGRVRPDVPIVVIPTCADLHRFMPGTPDDTLRQSLGLHSGLVIGYAGTMSNWYLRDETLQYFAAACRRFTEAQLLVVTKEDHERLRRDAVAAGVDPARLVLVRASFDQMPALLRLMDVGVFFIRRCFAKRASAATKLAEFLGCGVPVIINDGVGDSGDIVRGDDVGVVLANAAAVEFDASFGRLAQLLADPDTPARCRRSAERRFSLTAGAAQYSELYKHLTQGDRAGR